MSQARVLKAQCLIEIDRGGREGDFYPFLLVAVVQGLEEFVADEVLVGYALYPQDDVEVDAGFGKTDVAEDRVEAGDAAGRSLEDFLGDGEGDPFHLMEVAAVADPQGDGDGAFGERLRVIGDRG